MIFPSVINYDLGPGVGAFSTGRGTFATSENPYSGFNVCHYVGDSAEHVAHCRAMLSQTIGIASEKIIIPRQTHSSNVAIVTNTPVEFDDIDALVTSERGVALCINTADCVPILLADHEAGVIAAVHSGWRGTVARIAALTIDSMIALGAAPERIHAAMGPSICPECFEVGEEVADAFLCEFPNSNDIVIHSLPRPHINLAAAISQTLLDKNIAAEHIALPPVCSMCHPQEFFSARRFGINSGRTLSLIYMP